MDYDERSNNHFLLGAIIGGILGSATGLLFAPKRGEDLRHEIADRYHQLNNMTRSFTNKAKHIAHIGYENRSEPMSKNFILGTIAGSLVGATTAFLLAPKAGAQLRRELSNKYAELAEQTHHLADKVGKKTRLFGRHADSYTDEWKEIAGDILDKITSHLASSRGQRQEKMGQVMDWLNIGVRLWHNFQKGR
jgi:gas vesicle protein